MHANEKNLSDINNCFYQLQTNLTTITINFIPQKELSEIVKLVQTSLAVYYNSKLIEQSYQHQKLLPSMGSDFRMFSQSILNVAWGRRGLMDRAL